MIAVTVDFKNGSTEIFDLENSTPYGAIADSLLDMSDMTIKKWWIPDIDGDVAHVINMQEVSSVTFRKISD